MKAILILLIFPLCLFGQTMKYEKEDSIRIDSFIFPTYFLNFDNYSASDPAKVFVIPVKSFDSLKKQIVKFYFLRKQEYNEYYIIGINNSVQLTITNKAVTEFLNEIDKKRLASNRSTFLRLYSLDNLNDKIVYQSTTKSLQTVENLHYLNLTKDLCKYMVCPTVVHFSKKHL